MASPALAQTVSLPLFSRHGKTPNLAHGLLYGYHNHGVARNVPVSGWSPD
ncbi:hypothetical protein D1BOALGB6SA_10192 [Olavius sp. associated proteobacterium Delta 1]|nr:hypothetical protein D1BOALGB6SA_10192 [Olavius sp. associated proteobacterium Delta 1]